MDRYDPAALSERMPTEEIARLAALFERVPLLGALLDAFPEVYMILSRTRQIVFANQILRDHVERAGGECAAGMRLGEALGCARSCLNPGGCGASEFCLDCGALSSMLKGQRGAPAIEECRLTVGRSGEALDLRVFSRPLRYEGADFVIVSAMNISSEKRRQALERTFFHDIADTASGIYGLAEFLAETAQGETAGFTRGIARASRKLISEIRAQRDLVAAEHGDLLPDPSKFHVRELVEEVAGLYRELKWTAGRRIEVSAEAGDLELVSDRALVGRVLGNMVKNALEASRPGEAVTIGSRLHEGMVELRVHNPEPMPPHVQHQVFLRSFSTKGEGRGLGTYGMKLLAERYLRGKVGFESSPEAGTTFFVRFPQTLAD